MNRGHQFFEEIVQIIPSGEDMSLEQLCAAWQVVSEADWVWLWVHNGLSEKWELIAASRGAPDPFPLDSLSAPALECPAQLATVTKRPVYVDDVEVWSEIHNEEQYRVACAEQLIAAGCKSLVCIPAADCCVSDGGSTECFSQANVAVCCYYAAPVGTHYSDDQWLLMGKLTALAVMHSHRARKGAILSELNKLALPYLTDVKRRPSERRCEYLARLIPLIQKYVGTQHVSVFYRSVNSPARLDCLSSTGLFRSDGTALPSNSIASASYGASESSARTWRCFETGVPHIGFVGDEGTGVPQFSEVPPGRRSGHAWVMYPISGGYGSSQVFGVIRCVSSPALSPAGLHRNFDQLHLQILEFIAAQIASVLETLTASIIRERTVSIIKHDLLIPIRMFEDTVLKLCSNKRESDIPMDLKDLGATTLIAKNLVLQLDPDPTEIRDFNPVSVELEGEIVARVKAMLRHYAASENGMKIEFGNFRNIPALHVDLALIERVLCNLVVNAVKYGEPDTTIRIVPLATKDQFVVSVMNEGDGILPEEEDLIFDGNYRSPRVRSKKLGLGLGLKIARNAMERHGGALVLSQGRSPTVFSMLFPKELERDKK